MEYIQIRSSLSIVCFFGFFISTSSSTQCPKGCMCINVNVFCKDVGLTHIPAVSPETEQLTFINNNITEIPPDAFVGLPKLKSLFLNGNGIERLNPHSFRGLHGLLDFSLQYNPLKEIPTYAFSDLINITNLLLSHNNISIIYENAFFGTSNIRSLSLNYNPIHTLKARAFDGLSNVQYFTMPNGIKYIEPDAFKGLTNISYLDLNNMFLHKLQEKSFRGLANIAGFSIRDSNISIIESGAFDDLTNVEFLNIERSNIGEIENHAFNGMINIGIFKLQNNIINNLKYQALEGIMKTSKNVDISSNKFGCNCNLQWLLDTSERKIDAEPDIVMNNHCINPPDKKINSLEESDFENCPLIKNEMPVITLPKHNSPSDHEPDNEIKLNPKSTIELEMAKSKEIENQIPEIVQKMSPDCSSHLEISVIVNVIFAIIIIF